MSPSDARTNARARIMWGDDESDVRRQLVEHGLSESEADSEIHRHLAERYGLIRKRAKKQTFIGMAFATPAIIYLLFLFRRDGRSIGFVLIALGVGIVFLAKGLFDYIDPKRNSKNLSE